MKFHRMTAEELEQRFGVRFSQGRPSDVSSRRRFSALPSLPACADSIGLLASGGALLGALLHSQWQWLAIPAAFLLEKLFRWGTQKKIRSLSTKRNEDLSPVCALREGQRVLSIHTLTL